MEKKLQIFIMISDETIMKMLGLHSTGLPEQNTVELSEETLI